MNNRMVAGSLWKVTRSIPACPLGVNATSTRVETIRVGSTIIFIDLYMVPRQGRGVAPFNAVVFFSEFGVKDCNAETFINGVAPFSHPTG